MELLLNKIIGSVLQMILFAIVPWIWWAVTARKSQGFFQWIGLKRVGSVKRKALYIWCGAVMAGFILLGTWILSVVSGMETATSVFRGLGMAALPAAGIYAFFNTALPEELLFRGFLLKRISARMGFAAGNLIQSALFGLLHGVMFWGIAGPVQSIAIILFTGAIGWCFGFINEKQANGSIAPSWLIHGVTNLFSASVSLFLLF